MTSLAYRPAQEQDLPLVLDSWVTSYRTSHSAGLVLMDDWWTVMGRQVSRVLQRPGCAITVAYHPGESDHRADLYGWIAIETGYEAPIRVRERGRWVERMESDPAPLVHYVYVRQPYRRLGVARGLMSAAGVDTGRRWRYTCRTAVVSKLQIPTAVWSPLIARHPKTNPSQEK